MNSIIKKTSWGNGITEITLLDICVMHTIAFGIRDLLLSKFSLKKGYL